MSHKSDSNDNDKNVVSGSSNDDTVCFGSRAKDSSFLTSLREKMTTLRKVPSQDIKETPFFSSPFDSIQLINSPSKSNGLFLGPLSSTQDGELLLEHNIGTVVSVTSSSVPEHKGIKYIQYTIPDSGDVNILPILQNACDVIGKALISGSVLVHCDMGVSRSAAVVIAFKGLYDVLDYDEAFREVKKDRRCVSPNDGFVFQIKRFLNGCK